MLCHGVRKMLVVVSKLIWRETGALYTQALVMHHGAFDSRVSLSLGRMLLQPAFVPGDRISRGPIMCKISSHTAIQSAISELTFPINLTLSSKTATA